MIFVGNSPIIGSMYSFEKFIYTYLMKQANYIGSLASVFSKLQMSVLVPLAQRTLALPPRSIVVGPPQESGAKQ